MCIRDSVAWSDGMVGEINGLLASITTSALAQIEAAVGRALDSRETAAKAAKLDALQERFGPDIESDDLNFTKLNIPPEKVIHNIEKYGNTTSGTIPLCLWEWEDRLKKGDNLILSAFGGGFTWGAIYLKWAYGG